MQNGETVNVPEDSPGSSAPWSDWARRVATVVLLVASVVLFIVVGPIVTNTLLALILALILLYPVRFLTRRIRISYRPAVLIVFILYVVIATIVFLNLAIPVAEFMSSILADIQENLDQFIAFLRTYTPDQGWVTDEITGQRIVNLDFLLEPLSRLAKGEDVQELAAAIPSAISILTGTASTVTNIFGTALYVNILALIFLLEVPDAYKWGITSLPTSYRREFGILMERLGTTWNDYFRSSVFVAAILGALTWIQMLIMGIPNAEIIGGTMVVMSFIPIVGGFIALVPVVLVPLFQGSTVITMGPLELMLIVVGVNLFIQAIIWNVVGPRIQGKAVSLPISIIILAISAGTAIGGILGAFLAVPVTAFLREILGYVLSKINQIEPYPDEPEPAFLTEGLFAKRYKQSTES